MLFKHPILARGAEALEEVQKLALKIVKGFRPVPYDAPVQQLRLFFLTHRRIRGNLISMFKITHNLLLFPMESTFTHPTRKGLRGHAYKLHQQRCCTRRRQFDFTIRFVLFWNKRPAKIVNEFSVKSFLGTPGFPLAVPVLRRTDLTHHLLLLQPIASAHIDPRTKRHTQVTLPTYPYHPTWSLIVVIAAS